MEKNAFFLKRRFRSGYSSQDFCIFTGREGRNAPLRPYAPRWTTGRAGAAERRGGVPYPATPGSAASADSTSAMSESGVDAPAVRPTVRNAAKSAGRSCAPESRL